MIDPNELPDFFEMTKDEVIKWAEGKNLDLDMRLPKDEEKAKNKLIDEILSKLDDAPQENTTASTDDTEEQNAPVEEPVEPADDEGNEGEVVDATPAVEEAQSSSENEQSDDEVETQSSNVDAGLVVSTAIETKDQAGENPQFTPQELEQATQDNPMAEPLEFNRLPPLATVPEDLPTQAKAFFQERLGEDNVKKLEVKVDGDTLGVRLTTLHGETVGGATLASFDAADIDAALQDVIEGMLG